MPTSYYIFISIILLDAILGVTLWQLKLLEAKLLPIVCLTAISILDELLGIYFMSRFHNNLIVYYISSSIEYACIVWFIYRNTNFKIVKTAIKYSVFLLFAARLAFLYSFINDNWMLASNVIYYFITVQDILITVFSICYFKNIFDHVGDYKPLNFHVLIVVTGLLFYYSFDSFYRLALNHITNIYQSDLLKSNADINKVNMYAAMQAYNKFKQVRILLMITNMLLYTCIFIAFIKNAIIVKNSNISAERS